MRLLDLIILILLLVGIAIGLLVFTEIKKNPEVKYVVTEKVVKVTATPVLTITGVPSSVSGKIK